MALESYRFLAFTFRVVPSGKRVQRGWYMPLKAEYRCASPIFHKYLEGKMTRTLKRELNVPEHVGREANWDRIIDEIDCLSRARIAKQRFDSCRGCDFS